MRRLALLSAVLGCLPAAHTAQTIWFAPLDPMFRPWANYAGSVDYFDLFTPVAPWQTAASHVQVFKIYATLVDNFPDQQLRSMFADLDRRGIALAVEFGPLDPENCGAGVEGFNGEDAAHLASRIQELGGKLRYIAMDEPFYFAGIYSGDNSCRWSAARIAANAVAQIGHIKQLFPNVEVGDIEPFPTDDELSIPGWAERFRAWFDAWRAAAGKPLAFFHSDLLWESVERRHAVEVLSKYAGQRGIPFGIIYNGLGTESADADWVNHAERHFVDNETHGGAPPDHVIFQSWNPYPKHLLPETDPTTFTHLINRYFRTRTELTLTGDTRQISGTLMSGANALASASVQFTANPLTGLGSVSDYVLSGSVPAGATTAVVGVRVNIECGCRGTSDIALYRFAYTESNQHSTTLDFSSGLNGWGLDTDGQEAVESGSANSGQDLHLTVQPGQHALLNSQNFAVTAGASFTLHITARVSPDSAASGYFAIIFLAQSELERETLIFQPPVVPIGSATTAADGSYRLEPDPAAFTKDAYEIDGQYAGSDKLWPAAATLYVQLVPQVADGGVVNAASYSAAGVSPGEIVTIFGSLLGSQIPSTLELDADNLLANELSGTRVLFDGTPAPLIYAFNKQVSGIVPYTVAGKSTTRLTVEYQGFPSADMALPVLPSAPGVFTLDASGRGPGAILNQDYSVNTPEMPAARGSIVMIYATGEGETNPPGVDGRINGADLPKPKLEVTVAIGNVRAEVLYAGAATGQVAGLLQVNVRVPESAPAGPAVPVVVTIGGATSQAGVTMGIR
ncbi:MAG TPA: hypothetical protein VJN43_17860 [Bryobacteraceae bacterium]|nr:hypothetical protein [Bryobacteraceae bacterium]